MKRPFKYRVIRFVPDPIRGEMINLGLVMRQTDGSWFKAGFLRSYGKVQAIAGRGAVSYAKALVRDLEAASDQDGRQGRLFYSGDERLASLLDLEQTPYTAGTVELSPALTALTDDEDALFEGLFSQLVGRERRRRLPSDQQPANRDQLKRAFRDRAIHDWDLDPSQLAEGGVAGAVRHPVDFALYNGRLRAVVHTVSFAGDLTHAVLQRAVVSEAAWDLGSQGVEATFAMLYSPAPRDNTAATTLERDSVTFVKSHGITAIPSDDLATAEDIVRTVVAAHAGK